MIKYLIAAICLLFIPLSLSIPQQLNDWENPLVNGINRLPAHSTSYSYDNSDKTRTADRTKSSRILSLNGTWDFSFSSVPESAPVDFFKSNVIGWKTIDIPSNRIINGNRTGIRWMRFMEADGNDSWTQRAFPLKQYQIKPGKFSYSFTLKPTLSK
jgi:hypothetical protein